MAIFKGQVPFEIPNDEDDSKFTDEENLLKSNKSKKSKNF